MLGGIRSGKSRWAETAIAQTIGPNERVRYLATGAASDPDPSWSVRIAAHRARRPAHWSTIETADIATLLRADTKIATMIDDVGGWLAAALDNPDADELVSAVSAFGADLVIVSPEVGLTVVPATTAGRRFADQLGQLNQRLADICDRVVLVVAGQPVSVK